MRKLLRSLRDHLSARALVALCLVAAAVAVLPQVVASPFVSQRRAAFALKRAQAHLARREFDQARSEFHTALRLQPSDAVARRELAEMELAFGKPEIAFLQYETLTEMHPEDSEGWVKLADLMARGGQLEAPEAILDKAINVDASRSDARLLRGEIRFRLGRYYGALQDARAAVAAAPKDVTAWVLFIRSAGRSQGAELGTQVARKAIAALGEKPEFLPPLASLLAQSGRTSEARELLQREVAASASGSDRLRSAQLALARIELGADNPPQARRLVDGLLSYRPLDEDALALRAVIDAYGGQFEPTLAALDAALATKPESRTLREVRDRLQLARSEPPALAALVADMAGRNLGPLPAPPRRLRADAQTGRGNLGAWTREHWPGRLAEMRQLLETQLERRDWVEAQRTVDAAASDYPDSVFPPYLGGILELARGNLEDAERKLSDALGFAPRLPATIAALGRTWSVKGGPPYAAQQLMRLAVRDPGLSLARYMAARAYIEASDPLRAEASLARGLELQTDSAEPYQHLTDYFFGLDRTDEARNICRQGLERFPQNTDLQMMLAQIEAGTGQTKEAIHIYSELVSRRPDLDIAQYKLAVLWAGEGGEDSRRKVLTTIGELKGDMPSDPLLLDALGWMQYRADNTRRARVLLETAVKGAPEEPSVHYHLAMVYAQERELTLEKHELKTALESPRAFPERIEALRLFRLTETVAPEKTKASASSRN